MTKTIPAREVKIGDRIPTSIGVRQVLGVVAKSWVGGAVFGIEVTVQDPTTLHGTTLFFDPAAKVEVAA